MSRPIAGLLLSVLVQCVSSGVARADEGAPPPPFETVRITGAFELARNVIAPRIARVREAAGVEIALHGATSREGLRALLAGETDIALISAPLNAVCEGDDELAAAVRASRLRPHLIGASELRVVVNAHLGVVDLDRDALARLFVGEVVNWAELGGPRIGVTILSAANGDGAEVSLRRHVLRGEALGEGARTLERSDFILRAIAGRAGAIGVVDAASLEGARNAVAVHTDIPLAQPAFLVVRPDADEATRRLIARSNAFFANLRSNGSST